MEFGAHQVLLVRSQESKERLPPPLDRTGGCILTVPQSKGLEFDDVFLLNFFTHSPAKEEWRVLLQYLEDVEAGRVERPEGLPPLLPAEEAAADIGELGRGALRALVSRHCLGAHMGIFRLHDGCRLTLSHPRRVLKRRLPFCTPPSRCAAARPSTPRSTRPSAPTSSTSTPP